MIQQQLKIDYCHYLDRYGIEFSVRYPWLVCGKSDRIQGWKIHLSSIQVEAERLLERVLPYLIENQLAFKIAEDNKVLSQLNEGSLGLTQVGKFMTIYPGSDVESGKIAMELVELTRGFQGPVIPSDLNLGSIVYARFGGYNPVIVKNRFGFAESKIYNQEGKLQRDQYSVPFDLTAFSDHPFKDFTRVSQEAGKGLETGEQRLFGPGYLVMEVVKGHPKGSIFRVMDLRSQDSVGIKIMKQGRKFCFSDEHGRDVRDRLKHQYKLHGYLQDHSAIPRVYDFFEVNEDSYLVMDNIDGSPLETKILDVLGQVPWKYQEKKIQSKILEYFIQITKEVQIFHEKGFLHRDLTPRNIFITPDDEVYLIDLELAYEAGNKQLPFDMGTLGYMSPNQELRKDPAKWDDVYSLACIFLFGMTGMDPRKILFPGPDKLKYQLTEIFGAKATPFIGLIQRMLSDPVHAPDLSEVISAIKDYQSMLHLSTETLKIHDQIQPENYDIAGIDQCLDSAIKGLSLSCYIDASTGLWHSDISHFSSGGHNRFAGKFGVRHDVNSGIAGPLYLIGKLARFGHNIPVEVLEIAEQALRSTTRINNLENESLPGLHFGSAGRAIALMENIKGGLCNDTEEIRKLILQGLSGPIDWPDITHGAAGQGLGAIMAYQHLGDPQFLYIARDCTEYLIRMQNNDGYWTMPDGVEGISGETLTGFAHGVSGILYYLIVYQEETGHDIQKIIAPGLKWLTGQAEIEDSAKSLSWKYSDKNGEKWKWWCHGSPGIALTFLKMYEISKESKWAVLARKSLDVYPDHMVNGNLSQCHGMSGIGDIYLEAFRVLNDRKYLLRAYNIARVILSLRFESEGGEYIWLTENANRPTADLMVGTGGIIHFLARLKRSGESMGLPLMPDPE